MTGTTGVAWLLDFTDEDGHTPQVSEDEELVLTGTTEVDGEELLDLTGTTGVVGLLDFADDDGHTPHDSDEEVVDLAGTAGVVGLLGFTGDGLVLLGLTEAAGVVELLDDVQTPQDEEAGDVLLVVAGEAGMEEDPP